MYLKKRFKGIEDLITSSVSYDSVSNTKFKEYLDQIKTKYKTGTLIFVYTSLYEWISNDINNWEFEYKILTIKVSEIKSGIEEMIKYRKELNNDVPGNIRFYYGCVRNPRQSPICFDIRKNEFFYKHDADFCELNNPNFSPLKVPNGRLFYYVKDGKLIRFDFKKAFESMIGYSLDEGFDKFESKFIFENELSPLKEVKSDLLECYGKKPAIKFVPFTDSKPNDKFFALINCEVNIVSKFANVEYIKEHKNEILHDLAARIQTNKRFNEVEIPLNYFKVASMTLAQDKTLLVSFQLKIETEDDIY